MKPVLLSILFVHLGCVPEVVKIGDLDTGDTQVDSGVEACGLEELVFGAEVRDGGGACDICPHGVLLSFVGTITSSCTEPLSLFSGGGKLVRRFSLEPLGVEGVEPLSETEIEWVMGPEEVLVEEVLEMTLPDGDYELDLEFSDLPGRHQVSHVFQVRAD